ncbi:MATE family efflux transporter [uncultured Methanobrevibacter sp.]|uniref:MATE family efflux transporter n=1 Tax=uncultured Methanobrevibacter sp. TaxID=253161 RepID=UPI0025D53A8D|nr:MATE family efflux transporter [uncultured Methanobrevibacter sp.]
MISLAKFKIKEILISLKEIVLNTPEVIGTIFFASKMGLLTYLCSSYLGVAGLLAFLVYDNSETFVYIFLSGIMKTMSPIVEVLHKERDFEAVQYIISRSLKHVLLISLPVSIIFFIYPEILLTLFNIVDPYYSEVICLAIRITSFSLVGRCMSYLMANYTQAIEQNRISSIITFLEEFVFAVGGALILTRLVGGIGIWISILIAECLPVLVYVIYVVRQQYKYKDIIHRFFMLQNSNLITFTLNRDMMGHADDYINDETHQRMNYIGNAFGENATLIRKCLRELSKDIFKHDEDL